MMQGGAAVSSGDGVGRARRLKRDIATGLLWVFLYGYLVPEVSVAGNVGGLIGGALAGFVFGPRYASSYGMKRKWSTEVDPYSRDYRQAMGYATQPRPPLLPLSVLWFAAAISYVAVPSLRSTPIRMVEAILLVPWNR
jgi:hypothetical protein